MTELTSEFTQSLFDHYQKNAKFSAVENAATRFSILSHFY